MKVTVLIENTACDGFKCEHGLSVLIDNNGKQLLFDTGASSLFSENAEKMLIDLSNVDAAALSHAHYDHSGGFSEFVKINTGAQIYLRKESVRECFSNHGSKSEYIGIPKTVFPDINDRTVYCDGLTEISDGLFLVPHAAGGYPKCGEDTKMTVSYDGKTEHDDFMHEQTLVADTSEGLIIFSSCSHCGAENVVLEVKNAFPGKEIHSFIGGLHLMGGADVETLRCKPEEVKELGRFFLKNIKADVYTGHCTGTPAFNILKSVMGDRIHHLSSGMVIEF